jgi:heme-degrading monooxygenase HmoA
MVVGRRISFHSSRLGWAQTDIRLTGYTYMWEFEVPPANQSEFERIYSSTGPWIELFRRAPGYVGTHLLHDRSKSTRYVTIDRWCDEFAYREFRSKYAAAYAALDLECKGLASLETSLGSYIEWAA